MSKNHWDLNTDFDENLIRDDLDFIAKKFEEYSSEITLPQSLRSENLLGLIKDIVPEESQAQTPPVYTGTATSENSSEVKVLRPIFSRRLAAAAAMLAIAVMVGIGYMRMPQTDNTASSGAPTTQSSDADSNLLGSPSTTGGDAEGDDSRSGSEENAAEGLAMYQRSPGAGAVSSYSEIRLAVGERLNELDRNGYYYGRYSEKNYPDSGGASSSAASADGATAADESMRDFSETNSQVEGVAESDIVKTDGEYIFTLKRDDSGAQSISIVDAEEMNLTVNFPLDTQGNVDDIYLSDGSLVVISRHSRLSEYSYTEQDLLKNTTGPMFADYNQAMDSTSKQTTNKPQPSPNSAVGAPKVSMLNKTVLNEAVLGNVASRADEERPRATQISQQNIATEIIVYDVRDKSSPKVRRSYKQDGSYNTSRLYNDVLYTVTSKYIDCDARNDDAFMHDLVPVYYDSVSAQAALMPAADIIVSAELTQLDCYTIVSAMPVQSTAAVKSKAVLGVEADLYMDKENMYLASENYSYADSSISTNIIRLDIDGDSIEYDRSGSVSGVLLNQFAMDAYNGYLRVATTSSNGSTSLNNLYILGEDLQQVGAVENLAPGEHIKSVRFMGDTGYVVTFKTIDPLFVIDLSTPTAPKVMGELKIPGFSQYLHPMGENLLLGIGVDTIPTGQGGISTNGLKLSMFDVSDPTNPQELHSFKIGDAGTSSISQTNHRSIMFAKSKGIFAIQASVISGSSSPQPAQNAVWSTSPGSKLVFEGMLVFSYGENGFELQAQLDGENPVDTGFYDYGFSPRRAIYIRDVIYTVSERDIDAYSITDGYRHIGSVNL